MPSIVHFSLPLLHPRALSFLFLQSFSSDNLRPFSGHFHVISYILIFLLQAFLILEMDEFSPSGSGLDGRDREPRCRVLGKEPMGETSSSPVVPSIIVHLSESDSSRNALEVTWSVGLEVEIRFQYPNCALSGTFHWLKCPRMDGTSSWGLSPCSGWEIARLIPGCRSSPLLSSS